MLSQPPQTLEQTDFFNLVLSNDQPHLQALFIDLLQTPSTSSTSASRTTYARMLSGKGAGGGTTAAQTAIWEVRVHATGLDGIPGAGGMEAGFGLGNAGTVVPQGGGFGDVRGRAVWVMGRKVGEGGSEIEGSTQRYVTSL
jgi:hypothetical protein